ncbi:MAG: phage virion morphogenesis protein, partial [Gammaproteobacteria bacterium]
GDEKRNIPARPFLGLSDADRAEIVAALERHLRRATG